MINLLPIESQKEVKALYRARLINVIVLGLSFLIIVSGIILIPSYMIFKAKEAEAKSRLGEFSDEDKILVANGLKEIESFRHQITQVFPATNQKAFLTERMKLILDVRPRGLLISEIVATGRKDFALRGIARERQDVISFVDALSAIPDMGDVVSPISNLISEKDGTFTINLSFKD